MFSDFTSGPGTQAQLEKNAAVYGTATAPLFNTGLFGAPNSSVQVTP